MQEEDTLVRRAQFALPTPYIAPRNSTETRLAEIWRAVLSMDCVGVEDSYRDLGGDSFLAAVIFARIEEEFAIPIPMATLIDAPTVAKLAAKIEERQRAAGG